MVSDSLTMLNRKRVFEFAAAHRLPTTCEFDFVVRDGGLMSYAPDLEETFGRVAALVDRILKGAKPAELPFEQPTHFKLVINLKTAKALGLEVPTALLAKTGSATPPSEIASRQSSAGVGHAARVASRKARPWAVVSKCRSFDAANAAASSATARSAASSVCLTAR